MLFVTDLRYCGEDQFTVVIFEIGLFVKILLSAVSICGEILRLIFILLAVFFWIMCVLGCLCPNVVTLSIYRYILYVNENVSFKVTTELYRDMRMNGHGDRL